MNTKRIFDLCLVLISLPVVLPVFVGIALLIRVKIGSPVFFIQTRPGLNAKPFKMIKFRSMSDTRDEAGQLLPDDQRLGKFGRFLRSTSLDELPELINVLKGEMSLVGPRPLLMEYIDLYTEEQARRHDALPGITGWAQVNGRNTISWEDKFKLDVWYVDNRNFWLDLKILLITIKKVFVREGVSAQGDATMPKFKGSKK
ncbi:sugar transferase [Thiomicrorhabdus sediminis]|uniref:Sugar transferase n=1 Tax=Thiomicrorhabdus sediminis TaxID=2580412 RepID=A0A4P9K3V2_9GAMM|nr:sugar transferase [Thiomicrorhabdus sediminis]QCU89569.1 sugar transferase [Thiomicrorhabdus sediminis]